MRLDLKTSIAVSIMIGIFSTANYYIFSRFNLWLGFGLGWPFNALGAIMGGYAFIVILWHPLPIKLLYYLTAFWFGFIYFLFIAIVAADIISAVIPFDHGYLSTAALLVAFFLSIYAIYNNLSGRKVVFVKLYSPKIRHSVRVVLIADTHISKFHGNNYLKGIVEEINKQNPDMVCISGDFADGGTHYSAIEPLNEIKSPIYMVMGNHEVWNNHNDDVVKLLNKTNVNILHKSKERGVQLIGFHYQSGQNELKQKFQDIEIDPQDYNILLYHEPKGVEVAQAAGIDLMLSGHTHGGQIFPWEWVTKLAYNYIKGLYNYKGMLIYVSQGTGVWGPPMRLGSKNEVTVIDLKPKYIK